ncbi:MAG: hypothetical protein NZ522_02280, partial [Chitinophagales bacterium]|nr:hypothetical protein [Chitinophagales bacterium]
MKNIAFIYLIVAYPFITYAMPSPPADKSSDILLAGIKPHLFILEQSYILESNTGRKYGYNNQANFNTLYFPAFELNNLLYVEEKFLSPWQADARYSEFSSADTLKPVISQTHIRRLDGDTSYQIQWKVLDTLKLAELRWFGVSISDTSVKKSLKMGSGFTICA